MKIILVIFLCLITPMLTAAWTVRVQNRIVSVTGGCIERDYTVTTNANVTTTACYRATGTMDPDITAIYWLTAPGWGSTTLATWLTNSVNAALVYNLGDPATEPFRIDWLGAGSWNQAGGGPYAITNQTFAGGGATTGDVNFVASSLLTTNYTYTTNWL